MPNRKPFPCNGRQARSADRIRPVACLSSIKLCATPLTKEFDYADYGETHGDGVLPLALVDEAGKVSLFTAINPPRPQPGQTIISALSLEAQARAAELAGTSGERD